MPLDRAVAGVRVVNLGSLSNPLSGDPRASYALLDAEESATGSSPDGSSTTGTP